MNEAQNTQLKLYDRYPGLRAFEKDEKDLFYGRQQESSDLLDILRNEQMVLLFSKSGLGKSSLLNAGICPELSRRGYWPVRIRLQRISNQLTDDTVLDDPLTITQKCIDKEFQQAYGGTRSPDSPVLEAGEPRLWEWIKARPFPDDAVPVLLFDQFEEFFSYGKTNRDQFMLSLAELIHDRPPTRVSECLLTVAAKDRTPEQMTWYEQPPVKCLFAIRSDRLYQIDALKAYVPLIMRNRYELGPLQQNAARIAIETPAQFSSSFSPNYFSTPPFGYEKDVLDLILKKLSNETGAIEGAQLQMVCNYVEEHLKKELEKLAALPPQPSTDLLMIDKRIIADEGAIDTILNEFYQTQLRRVCEGEPDIMDRVGQVIEDNLIEGEQRIGCPEIRLRKELGDLADCIDKLNECRLIRPETSHLGLTYELSHDTLVKPVVKAKHEREQRKAEMAARKARELAERAAAEDLRQQQLKYEQREAKLRRTGIIIGAVLLVIGGLVLYYQNLLKSTFISFAASQQFDLRRQHLAFRLWEDIGQYDIIGQRSFLPFTGIDLTTDSSRRLIVVQYNDGLEVFRNYANDSTYNQPPDSIKINLQDYFQVARNTILIHSDTTLYGFWLGSGKKDTLRWPTSDTLLLKHPLLHPDSTHILPNKVAYKLSPSGRFLLVQTDKRRLQLYQIDPNQRGGVVVKEMENFSAVLQAKPPQNQFDDVVFSADERWLLLYEKRAHRVYLVKLDMDTLLVQHNVKHVALSTSGQQLTWSDTSDVVWLLDLQNQRKKRLEQVNGVDSLMFVRNNASLLIMSHWAQIVGAKIVRNRLDLIDLNHPTDGPQTITDLKSLQIKPGQDTFQFLNLSGQWFMYDPAQNQIRATRFRAIASAQVVDSWQQFRLDRDAKNQLILYDLGRNIRYRPHPFYKLDKRLDARFCPVRGETVPRLAVLFPDSLLLIDLQQLPRLQYNKVLKVKGKFTDMTFVGDMIQLKADDGFKALVFADGRKNQLPYLREFIYPMLSKNQ